MNALRTLFLFLAIAPTAEAQLYQSLHPAPKVSYQRMGVFVLDRSTALVVPSKPTAGSARAIAWLQRSIKDAIGDTLQVLAEARLSGRTSIHVGERDAYGAMRDLVRECSTAGEEAPPAQGYVLDITAGTVVLAGSDPDGVFNAVTSFTQFLTRGSGSCSIGEKIRLLVR